MDADKLRNMAIVSVADGALVGRITEVLFDTEGLRVAGFRATGTGAQLVVAFADIKSIGADAVTIENSQVAQPVSAGETLTAQPGLSNLKGMKVVDDAGTFVGNVKTIDVDAASGRMTQLEVQRGGVFGLGGASTAVATDRVRSIGAQLITISADATSQPPHDSPAV